jgi:hypothetical protein
MESTYDWNSWFLIDKSISSWYIEDLERVHMAYEIYEMN